MNTKNNTIKANIMRRVYYSYALQVIFSSVTLAGVVFVVSLNTFAALVHVAKVWQNFLSVPVGNAPAHVLRVLSHGDFLTLLSMVLVTASLIFIVRKIRIPILFHHRFDHVMQ